MNLNDYYHLAKKTLHNIYYQQNLDSEIITKCINVMFKEINECNTGITGKEVISCILSNNLELTRLTRKMIIRYLNEDNLNHYLKSFSFNCNESNKKIMKLK